MTRRRWIVIAQQKDRLQLPFLKLFFRMLGLRKTVSGQAMRNALYNVSHSTHCLRCFPPPSLIGSTPAYKCTPPSPSHPLKLFLPPHHLSPLPTRPTTPPSQCLPLAAQKPTRNSRSKWRVFFSGAGGRARRDACDYGRVRLHPGFHG